MINFTSKPRYALDDLIRLVHALRAPGGCPWDAAQTHLSIRRNFLEEAYEACEALDCDDEDLREVQAVVRQCNPHPGAAAGTSPAQRRCPQTGHCSWHFILSGENSSPPIVGPFAAGVKYFYCS